MATEEILMAGVRAGGNRQQLHERLRQHSLEAARRVKQLGAPNDLIDRIRSDPMFNPIQPELDGLLDPTRYLGLAREQVDRFLIEVVDPIRARYSQSIGKAVRLRV
jgi:adenylosuccinate lyase